MYKSSKGQSLTLLILLATTFLPATDIFNYLKIFIVLILYAISHKNEISDVEVKGKKIIGLWLASIAFAMVTVIACEGQFNQSAIVHELARVVYYTFVILLCSRLKISLKFLFYCCVIILSLHFMIQITQYFRLGIFDSFIETYYLSGNKDNIHYQLAIQQYYAFRSGSIFINPNVYVCYPYISLGVFLEYNRRTKSILPLIMILVAFLSIVLTGSRMGLGAFLIIIGWYILFRPKQTKRITRGNIKSAIFVLALIISLIFRWDSLTSSFGDMRSFSLDEAYSGSGATKIQGFVTYLSLANPLYWISGSLGSNNLNIQIDMEFGYVFAWFGILGIIWYAKLVKMIYLNNREFNVLSTIAFLSILLTGFGASSVLNMSVFPYICSIALTTLVDKNKLELKRI